MLHVVAMVVCSAWGIGLVLLGMSSVYRMLHAARVLSLLLETVDLHCAHHARLVIMLLLRASLNVLLVQPALTLLPRVAQCAHPLYLVITLQHLHPRRCQLAPLVDTAMHRVPRLLTVQQAVLQVTFVLRDRLLLPLCHAVHRQYIV